MAESEKASRRSARRMRCAIYTRKSSEEGLEQAFNSLDAQREACAAFILSQKHEGWTVLPTLYDDGGFSGGTMDRPALKRLLGDIGTGKVEVVVVYKIDRLTRSLFDFAKIVEAFDARGVSFVSITQQFNTTTSMGRLTLNVLLSFAQFEREVAGERIRDKIAASKKKGMWMGGLPSLGYDVQNRKLVVNEEEALTLVHIFQRYVQLRSVRALQAELDAAGIRSKRRTLADGTPYGGQKLSRGALLLQNRIYRGEITHKGNAYPGEHPAIVDKPLWDQVQAILAENRVNRATCDNLLTVRRDELEAKVLDGLKEQLMQPELVTAFIDEFHKEVNRQRAEQDGRRHRTTRNLEKTEREIRRLIEAIKAGVPGAAVKDEMAVLEARRVEFLARSEATPPPMPRLHPNLAELYRQKVTNLAEALNDEHTRLEAAECIRELIEEIRLVPVNGKLRVELYGELAALLTLANGHPRSRATGVQITMVAGARNHLYRTRFLWSSRPHN